MHYCKLNELSKLQGFISGEHLKLAKCNIMSLLRYQPCNLKVHMYTGTDGIFLPIKTSKHIPRSIRIFPAICNGIKTSKQRRIKIKALKNQENLVSKYAYIK